MEIVDCFDVEHLCLFSFPIMLEPRLVLEVDKKFSKAQLSNALPN